jgi:hypothetical protein
VPEPAFRYSNSRELAPDDLDNRSADYFAFHVARTPGDLLGHVQRVKLHWHRREGDRAFGALVDLFVALGPAGQSLRKRLLNQLVPILKPAQQRALRSRLATGLKPADALAEPPRFSVLFRGMLGGETIVRVSSQETESAHTDTLAEVQAYLEFGQIQEAKSLLEEALLREPEREDLHRELLEIYIHARDRDGLLSMQERLRDLGRVIGTAWTHAESTLDRDVPVDPTVEN